MNALTITAPSMGAKTAPLAMLAGRIVSVIFSWQACLAVCAVCGAAMWWHCLTVADAVASGATVARDALAALPWAAAAAVRATRHSLVWKGGAL